MVISKVELPPKGGSLLTRIKMKETWVQDVNVKDVPSTISHITTKNAEYIRNTGSEYVTGPSKSGKRGDVGIYFRDPTATNSKEM